MSAQLRIKTPEGIVFAYTLAGPVTRCLAVLIDLVCVIACSLAAAIAGLVFAVVSVDLYLAVILALIFIISVGYGVVCEWCWRGQTMGKRIMHLRVMDAEGLRLEFHQVLLRNLLRPVDMLPSFYLLGGIVSLLNARAQRLGDLAAGTVVVRHVSLGEPDLDQLLAGKFNSLRQHPHLEARLRQRVSADAARLALQALVRRDELDPASRVELFAELAEHFKSVVTFPPEVVEAMPDEQYIRNVVDLLFRTRTVEAKPAPRELAGVGG